MSRHSRNNTARSFFSAHEKQRAGYGSLKTRLGKDSLRPFDYCTLCIQPVKEPLLCPSGCIFCKECIYSSLLTQKERLALQKVAYERQQAKRAEEALRKADEEHERELEEFKRGEAAVAGDGGVFKRTRDLAELEVDEMAPGAKRVREAREAKASKSAADEMKKRVVLGVRDLRREHLKRTSYWIPEQAPDAGEKTIAKPDTCPRCPQCSVHLRLKNLTRVNFYSPPAETEASRGPAAGSGGAGGGAGGAGGADASVKMAESIAGVATADVSTKYHCPACMKVLLYQKAVTLKKCGHVFCESCSKQFIVPAKRCFHCDAVCKPGKGIIAMKQGGTGFSAHNDVEATVYRPTMT